MNVSVGLMRASERAFVATTWLRSYEHAEQHHMGRAAYWRGFGALVDGLLDTSDTFVARDPEDETHALAWACRARGENALHFAYVKWAMRDRQAMGAPVGLASQLLHAAGLYERGLRCTFTTTAWLKYAAKHEIQFEHDRQLVATTRASARRAPREERQHG